MITVITSPGLTAVSCSKSAVGIAVSHRCDLLVAVAQGKGTAPELQRAALDFLATHAMHRWMIAALGGR